MTVAPGSRARSLVLPAWLASRVQVPLARKVTRPLPLIEHTLDEVLSTLMVTLSPDEVLALGV